VLLIALGLLMAACSGASTDEFRTVAGELGGSGGVATTAAATTTAAPETTADGQRAILGAPAATDRKVIYDGQIRLQAAETRKAMDAIVALVEGAGGFIAAANVSETSGDDDQPLISLTLRLPAGKLNATLAGIREEADKVLSESLTSQDVTEEFVDIEAQLKNLKALEEELRFLLTELRDNPDADPAKLLQVFDSIRATRGEIEQLEGRRQLLSNLVALATLNVSIEPLPAATPIVPTKPGWEPSTVAKGALRNTVEALQGLADAGIRFALYILPVLLVTVGPFVLVGWFLYRRWKRRSTVAPA
jgi:hypothetical protein